MSLAVRIRGSAAPVIQVPDLSEVDHDAHVISKAALFVRVQCGKALHSSGDHIGQCGIGG